MGKFGSREMTAASDLDLIIVYDYLDAVSVSDGARPLGSSVYYTRLTQRLIAALTVPTRSGQLYEVDLRLRPSGRKGPLAAQFSAFAHYQNSEAETWEHMALTRARVVAGDAGLAEEIAAVVSATLRQPRDVAKLKRDVSEMRALIAREKPASDPWDLKLVEGGLLDIEFIAQYLVLAFSPAEPRLLNVSTREILARAQLAGLFAPDDAATLIEAHRLFTEATQIMRLTVAGPFDPQAAAAGVRRRIATATRQPDFESLAAALSEARAGVSEVFARVLGDL